MASLKNKPKIGEISVDGFEPPEGLVPVAVYAHFSSAGEAGLAILAMGKAYWTLMYEGQYILCVPEGEEALVVAELRAVASLDSTPRRFRGTRYREFSFGSLSFALYAVVLVVCFCWQQTGVPLDAGRSDSVGMMEGGQWTRALTALTLHGDVVHLVSNLVAGLGFAFFVARFFGAASGWLLILISGVLGNALNAWVYYPDAHYSIGASTAVFGALGLLTGVGLWVAMTEVKQSGFMPRWFIPIFGGITLLGLVGIGDGSLNGLVDVAAHISGFLCGLLLGLVAAVFQKFFVYLEAKQYWVGLLSLSLVVGAWVLRLW